MATLRGGPVDRLAVNFYEINGCESTSAQDPFNIYSDPSWKPLIELARDRTDRTVMRKIAPLFGAAAQRHTVDDLARVERRFDENGSELTTLSITAGDRTLTQRTRRDRDINTVWTIEHLLKDEHDLVAWMELPEAPPRTSVATDGILKLETELGDTGIVMLDVSDPLRGVASLFDMADYTVIALTEPELFRRALDRVARQLYPEMAAVAQALPGRLWRIVGPEYASPPYLPPALFNDYVTEYVRPMVEIIHRSGGFARVHSHGRLRHILDEICATGCDALDPIEPPPQGDVELSYVRQKYGGQLVLFGNLEITDIENLPTDQLAEKVKRALDEGTAGSGRGFVLMPSASPYGRHLPVHTLKNYEAIIEIVGA
jgi:hypothetical protein